MKAKVYLHCVPVRMPCLRAAGLVLGLGRPAVHTRVFWYWQSGEEVFCRMSQMTNDPPADGCEVVGRGTGYTIQVGKAAFPMGEMVGECDPAEIEGLAREFARDGGPSYVGVTCNTYSSWLIGKACGRMPTRPKGAVGWDLGRRRWHSA
jgi:hypothetical protein